MKRGEIKKIAEILGISRQRVYQKFRDGFNAEDAVKLAQYQFSIPIKLKRRVRKGEEYENR